MAVQADTTKAPAPAAASAAEEPAPTEKRRWRRLVGTIIQVLIQRMNSIMTGI